VGLVIGVALGFLVGGIINKKAKKSAQDYMSKAILQAQEAVSKAQTESKDIVLEAKERIAKEREFFEKEVNALKSDLKTDRELLRQEKVEHKQREQALLKKEETIEKKEETLDKKMEETKQMVLDKQQEFVVKEQDLQRKEQEVAQSHQKMQEAIEQAAKMSKEEAKAMLIEKTIDEAKQDAFKIVRDIEDAAKDEGDKKAREIVTSAIQRCCVDHCAEATISVVNLPSDELKGRIIGREGRNIRALEAATGVDLIVDDTPEVIVLSSFDPVRREIARLSLEKLISDGRIHPSRIEELVEKCKKEVDAEIKKAGDAAIYETNIMGMHPEMVKLVGRLKYRTSYGQNILRHSVECAYIAGTIAAEVGADVAVCKRGALLHDLGKGVDQEYEGTHVSIGVELSKKYKENAAVIHCIEAHHNDIEIKTIEALIVQIADAISGARPGARRESVDNYVKRLEKLETIANGFGGVEKSYALQAGREIRIIVKPEQVDDVKAAYMAKDIAKQIESEMEYPGQIKVNVIRESRATEFAK